MFLEVVDKLVSQLHTVDVEFLADKCRTLMASDIHGIQLFTDSFIKKLFKCSHSSLLRIYLLPFNTWLDNSILGEVVTAYKDDNLELLGKFNSKIDDTQLITLYPIPTYSQLLIPLEDSEYTILATKISQNCDELVLREIMDIKNLLISHCNLTIHAIQLAAIHYSSNVIYWMIPKHVVSLVNSKMCQGQHNFSERGIFQICLYPSILFSFDNNSDLLVVNKVCT